MSKHVSEIKTLRSDSRQYLKSELFRNQKVIECVKSTLVRISDTYFTYCLVLLPVSQFSQPWMLSSALNHRHLWLWTPDVQEFGRV